MDEITNETTAAEETPLGGKSISTTSDPNGSLPPRMDQATKNYTETTLPSPEAFEALLRSYRSLASEYRKQGEGQRRLRSQRNAFRKTLIQLASGQASAEDLKAEVARLTVECEKLSTERDKWKDMATAGSLDSKMTDSQIDRMVLSYAGDMMQSSTVDEGFTEEFHKLHQQETLLSANEKLKRDLQIKMDSRHALGESIKTQKSVYDPSVTVREELVEAKKETKRATEQYLAEKERGIALKKELEELKLIVDSLRQRLKAETDTVSTLLDRSFLGSSSSLPIVGRQDLVLTGADTHLVMESQQLSESNKALRSQKNMEDTNSKKSQELEASKEREKAVEKALSCCQQKLEEQDTELTTLRTEKRSWEIKKTTLNREVEMLNERLVAEHDFNETTRKELATSQMETTKRKRELQDLQIQRTTLEGQKQELKRDLAEANLELILKEKDLAKAKNEVESIRTELAEMRDNQAMMPIEKTSYGDNTELESVLKDVFELRKEKKNLTDLLEQQTELVKTLYLQLCGKDPNQFPLDVVSLSRLTRSASAALASQSKEKESVPAATKFPSRLHRVPNMSSIRSSSNGSLISPPSSLSLQMPSQKQKKGRPHSDPSLDRKVKLSSDLREQATLSVLHDYPPLGIPPETVQMMAKPGGNDRPKVHHENIQYLQGLEHEQSSTPTNKGKDAA